MGHVCINCGSDKVTRVVDSFTCHKCEYVWDVALEQANRVYLRAQGRVPAKSMAELAAEAAAAIVEVTPVIVPGAPPLILPSDLTTSQPSNTDGGANEPENQPAPPVSTELPTSEAGDSTEESNKKAKKG